MNAIANKRAAKRISRWVADTHDGNMRAAAAALGCGYYPFWRAANNLALNGPAAAVVAALLKHVGHSWEYWTGREK